MVILMLCQIWLRRILVNSSLKGSRYNFLFQKLSFLKQKTTRTDGDARFQKVLDTIFTKQLVAVL